MSKKRPGGDDWDLFDEANPDIRESAKAEAAVIAEKFGPMHSPDEIQGFINHNYPELRNARDISIGIVGNTYRIAVVDRSSTIHALKFKPEHIDQYLATKSRVERMGLSDPQASPQDSREKNTSVIADADHP